MRPPATTVFVGSKKDTRADHLVRIGRQATQGKAAEAGSTIEVLSMDPPVVKARGRTPGTCLLESARDRTAKIKVDQEGAIQEFLS